MTNKEFIFFHSTDFDKSKIEKIKNNPTFAVKPYGGLWACPLHCDFGNGWKEFIESEMPSWKNKLEKSYSFHIKESSKIYVIDCLEDLHKLHPKYTKYVYWNNIALDYEKLAKDYDAIYLTCSGQFCTRMPERFYENGIMYDFNLYGWDFECILIMNPEIIKD